MPTLILNSMSSMLAAYQAVVNMTVDLKSKLSEPKSSFQHVGCMQNSLMTSVVMENPDDVMH